MLRMGEAPVVPTIKTDLRQIRPGFLHEGQVILVGIICPVRDHGV